MPPTPKAEEKPDTPAPVPSPDSPEARVTALETALAQLAERFVDRFRNLEDDIEQLSVRLAKVENNPGLHLVVDKSPAPQARSCEECGATEPMHWDHCSKHGKRPQPAAEAVSVDA